MADLEGQWIPRTDEEMALIERLYGVTGAAYKEDVDQQDIVSALLFVAGDILTMDPEAEEPEPPDPVQTKKRECCPECDGEIADVQPFIGGEVEVQPCGCYVPHTQVPGWIQDG